MRDHAAVPFGCRRSRLSAVVRGTGASELAIFCAAMAGAGTVAVLLPGAFYALRGAGQKNFYGYNIAANTWTRLASTTDNIDDGGDRGPGLALNDIPPVDRHMERRLPKGRRRSFVWWTESQPSGCPSTGSGSTIRGPLREPIRPTYRYCRLVSNSCFSTS